MCFFEYYHFEACGHYGIEVPGYCTAALFPGGWVGFLVLCRPQIFLHDSAVGPYELISAVRWLGMEGFCRMCVEEFKLPPSIYKMTHNDHQHPDSLDLSTLDVYLPGPYLYCSRLCGTIPSLLGVGEWFTETGTPEGPLVVFPAKLERDSWAALRGGIPWRRKGMWGESLPSLSLGQAHEQLRLSWGMSMKDRAMLHRALISNLPGEMFGLWHHAFRERGMSYDLFLKGVDSVLMTDDWTSTPGRPPNTSPSWR